jgi:hypothetical protein
VQNILVNRKPALVFVTPLRGTRVDSLKIIANPVATGAEPPLSRGKLKRWIRPATCPIPWAPTSDRIEAIAYRGPANHVGVLWGDLLDTGFLANPREIASSFHPRPWHVVERLHPAHRTQTLGLVVQVLPTPGGGIISVRIPEWT